MHSARHRPVLGGCGEDGVGRDCRQRGQRPPQVHHQPLCNPGHVQGEELQGFAQARCVCVCVCVYVYQLVSMCICESGETRFGTHFMMLERLLEVKQPLQQMVMSDEWSAWSSAAKYKQPADEVQERITDSNWWRLVTALVKLTR
jgi:hypothetical protein